MVRRTDDPLSLDVEGTALDVLPETDHLVVAGRNALTVVTVGSAPSTSSWLQLRHNRNLVRLLKFNPVGTGCFASISGPYVDVFTLQGSTVLRLASIQAQSRKVTDFCWCPFDEKLMLSAAEGDSVSLWDLRSDLNKPSLQLGLLFGASQAKFAPNLNNLLMSANGTELRLWDLRHPSQSIIQFNGHQSRILCLDWHPNNEEKTKFFTSANDGLLKLWNLGDQKGMPTVLSFAQISAWRLVFSHEGEELAAMSITTPQSVTLFSNYGLENMRQMKGIEREDTLMDAAWHKSTTAQKSTTKYLYTLSKKQKLCRHAIAYELSNEVRDEMATPITQSAADEERDRIIAAAAAAEQQQLHQDLTVGASYSLEECVPEKGETGVSTASQVILESSSRQQQSSIGSASRSSIVAQSMPVTLKTLFSSLKAEQANASAIGQLPTPQSPIYATEWSRWIRTPNVTGGDLISLLEELGKNLIEGLKTTEVNFPRAAIGFAYEHEKKYRRICWEMRFHREYIENGLVFVEVIQKESPLTPEKASLFLTIMQHECDEQLRISSQHPILCRVFQQMPRIVDTMKLFSPSVAVDVPNANCLSKGSSQSGSANEEQANQLMANAGEYAHSKTSSNVATVLFPVTYTPSLYDHLVPAPRNCGARFNKSGYLVTFGRASNSSTAAVSLPPFVKPHHHRTASTRLAAPSTAAETANESSEADDIIPRILPPTQSSKSRRTVGGTSSNRLGSARSGGEHSTSETMTTGRVHPRSLAEYCVLVNPPPSSSSSSVVPIFRQSSSVSAAGAIGGGHHCSPPTARCASPAGVGAQQRPSSPWGRPSASSVSAAIDSSKSSLIEAHHPTGEDTDAAPSSFSPPTSIHKQPNLASSSTRGTVLSSSPNAARNIFSTPHQQHLTMRARVSSMGGGIPVLSGSMTAPAAAAMLDHPFPAATTSTAASFVQQQTSVIEHSSYTNSTPSAVMPEQSFSSTICVYDAATLLPISQCLARAYKLLGASSLDICRHNREQAAKRGRRDLLAVWRLLEQCVTGAGGKTQPKSTEEDGKNDADRIRNKRSKEFVRLFRERASVPRPTFGEKLDTPWAVHPLGRDLINRLLKHYTARHDLQTAAVITCVLNGFAGNGTLAKAKSADKTDGQKLERAKIVEQQQKLTLWGRKGDPPVYRPIGEATVGEQSSGGGGIFAMEQIEQQQPLGPGKFPVPPQPPTTGTAPPSRKTSGAYGVMPPSFAIGHPWSRQYSEAAVAAATGRTPSEVLQPKSTQPPEQRLSPVQQLSPGSRKTTPTTAAESAPKAEGEPNEDASNELMLDPALNVRFEELRQRYADILYRWRMYRKCAEVLKHCSGAGREADGTTIVGRIQAICWCSNCGHQQSDCSKCAKCHRVPIYCAICEQPCRGVVVTCSNCSHGGHFAHLARWFDAQSQCPLGCGCECKL